MAKDWYRNTTWNEDIEQAFNEKLGRARDKAQYLRIQACTLAETHPMVTIELLERYFALHSTFDHAQAYVDQATALLALGKTEDSLQSYEKALAHEAEFSHSRTRAYLELPMLIATSRTREHFARALTVLEQHKEELTFPIDHFQWHASRALILAELGDTVEAQVDASLALEAASQAHSGFRYHPNVGLVGARDTDLIQELRKLANAGPEPEELSRK